MKKIIENLIHEGFEIEITKISKKVIQVKLTSKNNIVKIGYGNSVNSALSNALLYMIIDLEMYLSESEKEFEKIESFIHDKGFIYNALDNDEMERYNKKIKRDNELWTTHN